MSSGPLIVWCNAHFPESAMDELRAGLKGHRLLLPMSLQKSNLVSGDPDPLLAEADVAFGQPDPGQVLALERLRWVHLTSAGYTRYDRPDLRDALRRRRGALTTSSSVYAEPCAEHLLAMMMSLARQLPAALDDQRGPREWPAEVVRTRCRLLTGQTVLILGFGAIGQRLAELLAPLRMNVIAVRRNPKGNEAVRVITPDQVDETIPVADHVVNILPASPQTEGFFTATRLAAMKRGAIFYNIGRGSTVDQSALRAALQAGRLRAAYLDVTNPEPPPPTDALWTTPNCYLTPHSAGGHADEFDRLVRHFLSNLGRFMNGQELLDRIIP